jgi:Protein of unknown function (DUF3040)
VPLSEHEQRQLEQIERALYAEYPRFASAVRSADPRVHYKRRALYAALGFLAGVALLVAGVVVPGYLVISVGGFVVMLASSMWLVSSWRRMLGIPAGRDRRGRTSRSSKKRSGYGLTERLEERWRRRQEGGGG